jgi:hypothetical protein
VSVAAVALAAHIHSLLVHQQVLQMFFAVWVQPVRTDSVIYRLMLFAS